MQEYKNWKIEQVECDVNCYLAMQALGLGTRATCQESTGEAYKAYPLYELDIEDFLVIWKSKILPDIQDWPGVYVCGGSLERVTNLINVFEDAVKEIRDSNTAVLHLDNIYQ